MNAVLENYYKVRVEHDKALAELEASTSRIVKVITKFFKVKSKNYWWAFNYHRDSDYAAPLPQNVDDGWFPIYIEAVCETDETNYAGGFPVEFFDMSDEEIVAYLKKEVERCEEAQRIKSEKEEKKRIEKEAKKNAVKASALAKLTPEERKVLKL